MLLGNRAIDSNMPTTLFLHSRAQIDMLLNIDAILSSQLVQPVCIHLIILLDLNRFQAGIVLHDWQLALQVLRCLACPGHYGVGSL